MQAVAKTVTFTHAQYVSVLVYRRGTSISNERITDHNPIQCLEVWVTVKPIINRRDGRSPHQSHNTDIIKLSYACHNCFTVIIQNMVAVLSDPPVRRAEDRSAEYIHS
jgi:hypothetical protein